MICDIGATFGHNVRPGDHSRMCSEPIGTYAMAFRPFPTSYDPFGPFFDVFMLFLMFACLYRTDHYIDRLAMYSAYYSIPMRLHSNPFRLLLTLLIFTVIDIPMFWLFIVSVDRIIAIGSDFDPYGLLVISDSSDAISTSPRLFLLIFYLPLPFYIE